MGLIVKAPESRSYDIDVQSLGGLGTKAREVAGWASLVRHGTHGRHAGVFLFLWDDVKVS